MSEKKLISCNQEIIQILDNIYMASAEVEVQQMQGGNLLRNKARIIHVNPFTMEFSIRPLDKNQPFIFDRTRPVEIFNANKSVRFKTHFKLDRPWQRFGILQFPKVINIHNTRLSERMNLEKYELPVNFKNFTIFDYSNRHNNIESKILDLSKTGLALKLDLTQPHQFTENDMIIFTLINGYSFTRKATGRLIYMNKIKTFNNSPYFKLGIKFDRSTSYEQITKFIDNQIYIQK